MIQSLNQATRTFGTHCMADTLGLTPSEVYDRMEGFKDWTLRDAAALAIAYRRPLSDLFLESTLRPTHQLMH